MIKNRTVSTVSGKLVISIGQSFRFYIGVLILLGAVLYYVIFRDFTPMLMEVMKEYVNVKYGEFYFGGALPTFLHVLGFSFILSSFFEEDKHILLCALFWLSINLLLEIACLSSGWVTLMTSISNQLMGVDFQCVFDVWDIAASFLSASVFLFLCYFNPRRFLCFLRK